MFGLCLYKAIFQSFCAGDACGLFQVTALRFCLGSCMMEGIFGFVFMACLEKSVEGKETDSIVTMVIIYFDVECQDMLASGTDLKGDGTKKYSFRDWFV